MKTKIIGFAGLASMTAGIARLAAAFSAPLQVAVVVTVIVGAAGGIAMATKDSGGEDLSWSGPLHGGTLKGRADDEWRDDFAITDVPAAMVRQLKQGAEVGQKSFRLSGGLTVDFSVVRADGLQPCSGLTTQSGETPASWTQAVCPARLTVIDKAGHARQLRTTACLSPEGAAPTRASLDPQTEMLTLSTLRNGQIEPACNRTIRVPVL